MSKADLKKECDELVKLININEDACEFYAYALDKAESENIKNTFRNLQGLHNGVVLSLQQELRNLGEAQAPKETMVGKAHKFWGELMVNVSNDVDETLVAHLEEAEDRCLHSMKDALKNEAMAPSTKMALTKELSALQKSHDYMKSLKEYMKQAA